VGGEFARRTRYPQAQGDWYLVALTQASNYLRWGDGQLVGKRFCSQEKGGKMNHKGHQDHKRIFGILDLRLQIGTSNRLKVWQSTISN
jgi:hypothetical protein